MRIFKKVNVSVTKIFISLGFSFETGVFNLFEMIRPKCLHETFLLAVSFFLFVDEFFAKSCGKLGNFNKLIFVVTS